LTCHRSKQKSKQQKPNTKQNTQKHPKNTPKTSAASDQLISSQASETSRRSGVGRKKNISFHVIWQCHCWLLDRVPVSVRIGRAGGSHEGVGRKKVSKYLGECSPRGLHSVSRLLAAWFPHSAWHTDYCMAFLWFVVSLLFSFAIPIPEGTMLSSLARSFLFPLVQPITL
jgi:hypothetical protein